MGSDRRAFVLDLDQTMVGDVTPVLRRFRLLKALKDMGLRAPTPESAIESAVATTPLMRPGLGAFLRRQADQGSALHVFTAAERSWAQAVVRAIQRTAGVKFASPLFARDNCVVRPDSALRKSLATVAARSLMRGPKMARCALPHTTVVDNLPVWDDLGGARFVQCPSYDYRPIVDPVEGVPAATLRDPRVRALLASMCAAGDCYDPAKYADPAKSACHKHRWMAREADAAVRQNRPHMRDTFFDTLA